MKHSKIKTYPATDDGSFGFKGYTTQVLEDLLKNNKIDIVYTCGPELMMKFILDICEKFNIQCELSLERFMKCGIGACGQCCVDNGGKTVCKDGPVFQGNVIKNMHEFGKYHRTKSGRKVML